MNSPRYSCHILKNPEFSRQILEKKYVNIEFHYNPFNRSRVVPCGQIDGRMDMKKLIIAFRNFADAPKMAYRPECLKEQTT